MSELHDVLIRSYPDHSEYGEAMIIQWKATEDRWEVLRKTIDSEGYEFLKVYTHP